MVFRVIMVYYLLAIQTKNEACEITLSRIQSPVVYNYGNDRRCVKTMISWAKFSLTAICLFDINDAKK